MWKTGLQDERGQQGGSAERCLARVAGEDGNWRVVAAERIGAGRVVLRLDGRVVARPSKYSVQIGADSHLVPWDALGSPGATSAIWPYLNHSCDPNAIVDGRLLISRREIAEGESITFDYNSTEYDIATPFACRCGACGGRMIRGYRHLSDQERGALAECLAAYLRPPRRAVENGD